MPEISSKISAADVTSTACPFRIIKCVAVDAREYTEPGTAISGRPQPSAQLAVLRAPERSAASTTTVPRDIAAISRLRARNRTRVGCAPGGNSETSSCSLASGVKKRGVTRWISHVDAIGQHTHGRSSSSESTTMRSHVDAEGATGKDGHSLFHQIGGEIGRNAVSVRGCRP